MSKISHILAVKESAVTRITDNREFVITTNPSVFFKPQEVIIAQREWLETNEDFMQVIPYTFVIRNGAILAYRRAKSGGEDRLHAKVSIGFGGHVELEDLKVKQPEGFIDLEGTIVRALHREMVEETNIKDWNVNKSDWVGIINDRSNPVGRVHVGIANFMLVDSKFEVKSRDKDVEIIGFFSPEELAAMDNLEAWTKILIENTKSISWAWE